MITDTQTISIDLIRNRAWHTLEATLDTDDEGAYTTIDVYVDDTPVFEPVEIAGHLSIVDLHAIGQELATGRPGRFGVQWVPAGQAA